jgi:hypothetical protein
MVEYTAITCVNVLVRWCPKVIAGSLLTSIIERLNVVPAIEYVQCLGALVPCFTEVTISSCIIPLVRRFLARGDAFQFAIGEFLTIVDLRRLRVTTEVFSEFMQSKVIVNEYMVALIKLAESAGCIRDDWISRIFVEELVAGAGQSRLIRVGAVRVVLAFSDAIPPRQFHAHLATMFRWADEDIDVGMALLSKADEIMTPKTIHLFPDFRECLGKICQVPDLDIRMRLPAILSGNPTVFLGDSVNLHPIFRILAADRGPEFASLFLDHFATLFAKSAGSDVQQTLFSFFLSAFNDPTPEIRSRLLSSLVYPLLGRARISVVAPLFLNVITTIASSRDVHEAARSYVTFPPDAILGTWQTAVPVFFGHFCRSPFGLLGTCHGFCEKLLPVLGPEHGTEFTECLIRTFFQNELFSVRQIAPALAGAISSPGQHPAVVDMLLQALTDLSQDPVASVRGAIFAALVQIKGFYASQMNFPSERKTTALFMSFRQSDDPFVAAKWNASSKIFLSLPRPKPKMVWGSKSHTAMSEEPKIPQVLPCLRDARLNAQKWGTHGIHGGRVGGTPVLPRRRTLVGTPAPGQPRASASSGSCRS